MEVQVLRWNPFTTPDTPTLRGFCKLLVTAGGLAFELNDVKLHENQTGEWLQLPARMYTNNEGEKKFSSYFYWASRENYDTFMATSMAAMNAHRGIADRPAGNGDGPQVQPVAGQQPAQAAPVYPDEIPF